MIQALGRALARQFLVFPREGRRLQPLQVMFEQDAGGASAMTGPSGQQGGVVGAAGDFMFE